MANQYKTYRLSPTWDFAPDGPLALGSVLANVKRPVPPLAMGTVGSTTTTTTTTTTTATATARIFSTTKSNYTYTTSLKKSVSGELSISFLSSILGVGPAGGVDNDSGLSAHLFFTRLETREWYPSTDELKSLIRQSNVSQYLRALRKWVVPKQVYVVTGVKIGYGAQATTTKVRHVKTGLEVDLDPGAFAGVSNVVTLGPKLKYGVKKEEDFSWSTGAGGEGDGGKNTGFVFAYKVQRVKVKQTKKPEDEYGVTAHVEYSSGAMLGVDDYVAPEAAQFEIDTVDMDESGETDETAVLLEASDGSESLWLVGP